MAGAVAAATFLQTWLCTNWLQGWTLLRQKVGLNRVVAPLSPALCWAQECGELRDAQPISFSSLNFQPHSVALIIIIII